MKDSVHLHFMIMQCTLHFKGHQQFIDILKKELSGQAWRNGDEMLNDPELDKLEEYSRSFDSK